MLTGCVCGSRYFASWCVQYHETAIFTFATVRILSLTHDKYAIHRHTTFITATLTIATCFGCTKQTSENVKRKLYSCSHTYRVMHCLTMGIRSEKYVVWRFRHCANITECILSLLYHACCFNLFFIVPTHALHYTSKH
jgi:hypothetical protein